MILAVQVADIAAGGLLLLFWDRFGVPGEVFGLPVLKFVALALIAIGAVGYVLFAALARLAAEGRFP
jgi:hypothetical protein